LIPWLSVSWGRRGRAVCLMERTRLSRGPISRPTYQHPRSESDPLRFRAQRTQERRLSSRMRQKQSNNSAKEGSFVAAAFREWSMKFNLMASMDCEPRTASLAFGVLVKFIMELSQIGVDAVPQDIHLAFGALVTTVLLSSANTDPIQPLIHDHPCQLQRSVRP
jgi:hypothetical protein